MEAKIIFNLINASDRPGEKFIPVLLEGGQDQIPLPVRGHQHYMVSTSEGYEGLYRYLSDQPAGELRLLPPQPPRPVRSFPLIEPPAVPATPPAMARRSRQNMLRRVRDDRIHGVLDRSLYRRAPRALNRELRPEQVEHPVNARHQEAEYTPEPLPPGTKAIDIFFQQGNALLILGSPSCWKKRRCSTRSYAICWTWLNLENCGRFRWFSVFRPGRGTEGIWRIGW